MNKRLCLLISSGFGVGYSPLFPGTLASLIILIPIWFIKENLNLNIFISLIIFLTITSIYIISNVIEEMENKDPKFIVLDEYIGQAVALIFCRQDILDYLIAFIGFRFLDILKPFPINYIDKIKNAYGVIFDDILAGFFISLLFFFHYEILI